MTKWLITTSLAAAACCMPLFAQDVSPERIKKLNKMADSIQGNVESLRGLKFKSKVPKGIQTRKQLRKTMEKEFARSLPKHKIRDYEATLSTIGLIPKGTDLEKLMLDVYSQGVGGFYDPRTKRLYLIANPVNDPNEDPMMKMQRMMFKRMGMSQEKMVMAHELTHALQDQNFDLLQLDLDKLKNDDRLAAIKCLIEGDASIVQYDFLLKPMGQDHRMLMRMGGMSGGQTKTGSKALNNAPTYIKTSMVAPYTTGLKFVAAIKAKGGWAAINKMYTDPPASTEQILHPEKYLDRDQPTRVSLRGFNRLLKRGGFRKLGEDTLGELYMSVLLGDKLGDQAVAKTASAGWDGDRYGVYRNKQGRTMLVLYTTFDTVKDAKEFYSAYRKVQRGKKLDASWIKRDGKNVYALENQPADLQQALIAQFSKTRTWEETGGMPKVPTLKSVTPKPITPRTTDESVKPRKPAAPFGYSVPEGWTARANDDRQYPITLTSASGGEIKIGILRSRMSAAKVGKLFKGMLPEKIGKYEEVRSGDLPREGKNGYFHSFKGSKSGARGLHQYVQIIIPGRGKLYSIMFSTPARSAKKDKPALRKFIDSFRAR